METSPGDPQQPHDAKSNPPPRELNYATKAHRINSGSGTLSIRVGVIALCGMAWFAALIYAGNRSAVQFNIIIVLAGLLFFWISAVIALFGFLAGCLGCYWERPAWPGLLGVLLNAAALISSGIFLSVLIFGNF